MSTVDRPLRADAERNRRAILDTARELFAERGLGVSLDDIARHAGLGVGTVYRRFASREAIIAALFDERLDAIVSIARESLEDPDPWSGFRSFFERTVELQAADRGLKELVLGTAEGRERIARMRDEMRPLAQRMVARAQEAGVLRADFAPEDLPLMQIMLGSVADATRAVEPDLWRRYLALLLDGLQADGDALPVPPVPFARIDEVMAAWRPSKRGA